MCDVSVELIGTGTYCKSQPRYCQRSRRQPTLNLHQTQGRHALFVRPRYASQKKSAASASPALTSEGGQEIPQQQSDTTELPAEALTLQSEVDDANTAGDLSILQRYVARLKEITVLSFEGPQKVELPSLHYINKAGNSMEGKREACLQRQYFI